MTRYIVRRLFWVILVMLIVTMVTFVIFFVLQPRDPALAFAGKQPTPELIEEARRQFGLDKPLYQQYLLFVQHLVTGDEYGWPGLGYSFNDRVPIREELFDRAGVTIQLAFGAAIIWLLLGIPIGIISALRPRTLSDRAAMGFALFGVSAPVFWLGLMSLLIFWQWLGILPGTGYVPFSENPASWFGHFIMPWFVLALLYAAFYARMVRANLIDTMGEDYIRTARAKGLSERTVVGKHGLRASLTPVVTMFGIDFATLLGGAVITETVFNLPGLGAWVVSSARTADLPAILGVTVMASFFVALLSLIVDIVYAYLDPRVRYS
jgi:peptide/nickel transport system permease protein